MIDVEGLWKTYIAPDTDMLVRLLLVSRSCKTDEQLESYRRYKLLYMEKFRHSLLNSR